MHIAISTLVVALVMVMMKLGAVRLLTKLLQKLLGPSQLLFAHRFLVSPVFFLLHYLLVLTEVANIGAIIFSCVNSSSQVLMLSHVLYLLSLGPEMR